MPLYPYLCNTCGLKSEELFPVQGRPAMVACSCGGMRKATLSVMAKTPGTWGGVDTGYFDRGLGQWVDSHRDADKIAKAKGLVRASDFDKSFIEDKVDAFGVEQKQIEADSQEYQSRIASGKSATDAAAETFSVSKLQQRGMLDTAIRGE